MKLVKEQYLKLAQKYHPDSSTGLSESEKSSNEENFIKIKESFDRITVL